MFTKLNYAKKLLEMGISIIPLHHRSKRPTLASWDPFKTRLASNTEYRSWFASDWCNYGVIAGWGNLVVIDFDDMEIFNLWSLWIQTQGIDTQYVCDKSFKVHTARGMHVYVTAWERVENQKRKNIDIQAQGKYVVGPGCVHPSGHVYEPIGEMIFPVVFDLNEILPLELFPLIANSDGSWQGAPMEIQPNNTECSYDPFATASMSSDVDLITKIKNAIRIESLFPDARRTSTDGRWYAAWCPFHNDQRPGGTMSFWIDIRQQICGCAVCNFKPFDVINLYARQHHISESAAVSELAKRVVR